MFIRNAFQKFKADFDEASSTLSPLIQTAPPHSWKDITIPSPSLRPLDTLSQTISDDEPRYKASNAVRQGPTRDNLPAIPFEDDLNDHETVGPLQSLNRFRSLQSIPSVSSNASLPSIESGTSSRARSDSNKFTKPTPVSRGAVPIEPMSSEFAKVSSLLKKQKNRKLSVSSNHSSLPSAHSEPSQQDSFISAVLTQKSVIPNGTPYDFEQPSADLLSMTSRTTNGDGVLSTPQVEELPEYSSNPTSASVEVVVYPMQFLSTTDGSSVTQTSQSHDDSVIQTSAPTVINDNDDQQHPLETNTHPDSTPITRLPPSTREINPIAEEVSVPGDFPLDEPSFSPDVQNLPLDSMKTVSDGNPIPPVNKVERRRKPSSSSSYLLNLVTPQVPDKVEPPKTSWRPLRSLQPISESDDNDVLARRMEELGRIRRMQSRNLMVQPKDLQQTTATSKAEIRPQLQTLQKDNSSDVATLLKEAYIERQKSLQTQLDKALAELRDAQAENKRLTTENQSQQHSISQLKIALGEAKHEQEHSLTKIKNELRDANSSLIVLNEEKKGWQDKLDSMQHKLSAAERQVRCLDHLTRHKLESRQEAGYGQPKRRGLFASTPASTDVIALMRNLNEEIYQTCVQLVEGLEHMTVFSTKHKPQVQKVLGDHLTTMMEDQAIDAISGYNMLLMQAVLEVFMTRWCSSIIEAFYPQQESFADLLVELSTQRIRTSGSGK